MRSINRATLLGHLGRDAETKFRRSGVALTTFSLATTRSVKDGKSGEYRDETDWHNVVLWRAEKLAQYLKSGVRVYVEGCLQTRSWEDNEGNRRQTTQVVAEQLILLGSSNGNSRGKPRSNGAGQQRRATGLQRGAYSGATDREGALRVLSSAMTALRKQ